MEFVYLQQNQELMTTMETFLELLKYTIPAIVVLIATTIIVSKFLINDTKKKQLAIFQEGLQTTIRLRLQAYERLALFIERIQPREIIVRLYQTGMTVQQLRTALVISISKEYEHNLSQQIYVSAQVWRTIQSVREQELAMINQMASTLKPEASAKELHKMIIDFIMTTDTDLPSDIALEIINNEAKIVLSQQG